MAVPTALLDSSERLRQRRYEVVPVEAPTTRVQGRQPGPSTAPADLAELISSIANYGVLAPLLLEETADDGLVLVAGERRLRALRWGHVNQPDNPNFQTVPAVICPGPLTENERRVWQLVENLARTDLQPGELALALMFQRCAIAAELLTNEGHPVPASVWTIEDPVRRWEAIEAHRTSSGLHHVGAPWHTVISHLGVELSAQRASELVRAFKQLPSELSAEMDANDVKLAARQNFLKLNRGRQDAAAEIWEALKTRQETELLSSAVDVALGDEDLSADEVCDEAERRRDAADEARSAANRADTDGVDEDDDVDDSSEISAALINTVNETLDELLVLLRSGMTMPEGFSTGSLQLRLAELAGHTGQVAA